LWVGGCWLSGEQPRRNATRLESLRRRRGELATLAPSNLRLRTNSRPREIH
jgi:hypothetical protein